jgi:uncharacterized protein (TIGR00725 family)
MRKFQIAVIGSGSILEDSEEYLLAKDLGKNLVDNDFIIICGGLFGVMQAVCEGAKKSEFYEYGRTIGILPDVDKVTSNQFVDIQIATGMSKARNQIIIASADAVIAISGGAGTLSELSFAWQMKKPILVLKDTGGWSEKLADSRIDASREDKIIAVSTVSEAITTLKKFLSS